MKRCSCLLLMVFSVCFHQLKAQDSIVVKHDSLMLPKDSVPAAISKKRTRDVIAANVIGYSAAMTALYTIWYKDYPRTAFHLFNDNHEWNQMDKVGHAYSAYVQSRMTMALWQYADIPRKKRVWMGGLSGAAYQTAIELFDGFSEGWGWSWGDFGANIVGSSMLVAQELTWKEQRMVLKFSFHRKTYATPELNERANQIFGTTLPERMLKDYNGQSYWLSANLRSFFPSSSLPEWFNIAIGYGAEGMFDAEENKWISKAGVNYDATNIERTRQFYLAPDIDLTRIKTKSKLLRTAFFILNSLKFPTPSLELNNGKLKWNWMHF